MPEYASAFPRKQFFLDMFTRDISVEDCILDLVDNSIDALIRTRGIDISKLMLEEARRRKPANLPTVKFSYSPDEITLVDKCGGIPKALVLRDVFSFGHTPEYEHGALGAYGVGLKRALFKLGRRFALQSQTTTAGFTADVDVDKWAANDQSEQDWRIPVNFTDGAQKARDAGTSITITHLRPEVVRRFSDAATMGRLRTLIRQAYTLFLGRHVEVSVEGKQLEPLELPIGGSPSVEPGLDVFEDNGVTVKLMASLAPRDDQGKWEYERSGWYVFCNGRLVIAADRTDLTGWGLHTHLPSWHPKYAGFFGIAFFESDDPLDLPWTTTKRGLNRESSVYALAKDRMAVLARPVIAFLNQMYPSELNEADRGRRVAQDVKSVTISKVAKSGPRAFSVKKATATPERTTTRVQYDADVRDLDRIRRRLGKKGLSATRIGEHTLKYYLRNECPR